MTKDDPAAAQAAVLPEDNPAGPRKSRTIRFSNSEWNRVKTAATEIGVSVAEFVRRAALTVADSRTPVNSSTIPPGIVALIESTYRYSYIIATLKRNELIREERTDEINHLVQAARESQAVVLNRASE